MILERIKDIIRNGVWETLYTIISIIFLFFLNNLNRTLLSKFDVDDIVGILSYNSYKPVVYFFITLILVIIGVMLFVIRYKRIKSGELDWDEDIKIFWYSMIYMIVIAVVIVTLIIAINNPILRAIILFAMTLMGLIKLKS